MISLLKAYPVGSLLFWKTDHPPEMKNLTPPSDRVGSVQVILDGQQRLTALYLLITGKIPYYYAPSDIESDPRDLFFKGGKLLEALGQKSNSGKPGQQASSLGDC